MAKQTVLLVEDNQELRELAAELLVSEGFDVCLAATGAEVLELFHSGFRPDCILLDLGLPDMGTAEFLARFADIPMAREIPVGLVSGNSEIAAWASRFRASRVIRKPYGVDSLLEAATELCGKVRHFEIPAEVAGC